MNRRILVSSLIALPLLLAACKPGTLEMRWPGPQEPSTESLIRFLDGGLPRPGTSELVAQPQPTPAPA